MLSCVVLCCVVVCCTLLCCAVCVVLSVLGVVCAALLLCHDGLEVFSLTREFSHSALGEKPWPKIVPDWLYRLSWLLQRIFHSDFHLMHVLHLISVPQINSFSRYFLFLMRFCVRGCVCVD